jgi:cytochrome c553
MEMKVCGTCKTEFPKTEEYFFKKTTKQQNKSGFAVYYSFRSDCIKCHGKKGMTLKIKKRCQEMNCDVSDYRENWKKQYSKTRTKYNFKTTKMKFHVENLTDIYIANIFRKKVSEIPKEMIETKRLIIKLKRLTNGK